MVCPFLFLANYYMEDIKGGSQILLEYGKLKYAKINK
jgi:hypothetical protein